jgi:hypothetical protein
MGGASTRVYYCPVASKLRADAYYEHDYKDASAASAVPTASPSSACYMRSASIERLAIRYDRHSLIASSVRRGGAFAFGGTDDDAPTGGG